MIKVNIKLNIYSKILIKYLYYLKLNFDIFYLNKSFL